MSKIEQSELKDIAWRFVKNTHFQAKKEVVTEPDDYEQGWGRCKKHLEQPISRIVILDDERAIIKGEDV